MNKKLLKSLCAMVLAVAGIFAITHVANAALKGDVNGDGSVNAADVTALYNYILNGDQTYVATSDVNGDGAINAGDVTAVYNIILGLDNPGDFETVYILGNQNPWDPANGQEMTTTDGVIYTATLDAKDIYNGYSYFGFTTRLAGEGEGWDEIADYRFGAVSDGNFLVTDEMLGIDLSLTKEDYHSFQIPTGKYELTLNLEEMTLKIEKGQAVIEDVYILGEVNGNSWAPNAGVQMATEDGVTYTATITTKGENEGYSYFSFTKALGEDAENWDAIADKRFGAVSDGDFLVTDEMIGREISLTAENGQAFKIGEGEYALTLNLQKMTLKIDDPNKEADKVYILGEVNGNSWDPAVGVEMATEDGKIYTATVTTEGKNDGYNYFSFTTALAATSGDWDAIKPYRFGAESDGNFLVTDEMLNRELTLKANGKSFQIPAGKWELTVDLENMTLVIVNPDKPIENEKVYILGEVNGNSWAPNQGVEMTTEDGKIYTAKITAAGEYGYFGFSTALGEDAENWDAIADKRFGAVSEGDFLVTAEMLKTPLSLTKENYQAFKIPAGEYDLTLNLAEMTLEIDGEIPVEYGKVYVMGEVNGNAWNPGVGVEMTTTDGKTYTATVTTKGENEGYSYFGFSKVLADSTQGWDDIAAQRFGAVSEGDFLVTKEMTDIELALTAENYQAFKIPAGEFELTVNVETMKLVIKGEIVEPQPVQDKVYILGEVNGNSWAANTGFEMTTEDGKIYTADITTTGSASYFGFTTMLGENENDWDAIKAYRFGAVADDMTNFLVTDEMLGRDLSLVYKEDPNAFQIAAGKFTLTLDKENMTLKIEGEFDEPEPAGDNWYLIGTNNEWSQTDKSAKFTQDATNKNVYTYKVENVSGDFWFKIANEDCYSAANFWNDGTILSVEQDGDHSLKGNLVKENKGALCIPANYKATYLNITIDVENLTYEIETDGKEPEVDPTAEYDFVYVTGDTKEDNWSGNGGVLASEKGANDYYGFTTLGTKFKIQKDKGSWATNWGGSNGTLVSNGADIQASGYVYINANIGNLTYSVTEITKVGIVGDAVGSWDNDVELTQNADGNWEGTVTFTAGEFKFRMNGGWDIDFGGSLSKLVAKGGNIKAEAGTYKVVLVLTNPSEYSATLTPAN